jgi:hypothetical protein
MAVANGRPSKMSGSAGANNRWGAFVVSFSISRIKFVIYDSAPDNVPAMVNDRHDKERDNLKNCPTNQCKVISGTIF